MNALVYVGLVVVIASYQILFCVQAHTKYRQIYCLLKLQHKFNVIKMHISMCIHKLIPLYLFMYVLQVVTYSFTFIRSF